MYNNKKDKEKDTKYRKVEAMWRRGCSVDEIVRSVKLSKNGRTRCYTENICIGYETSLIMALSFFAIFTIPIMRYKCIILGGIYYEENYFRNRIDYGINEYIFGYITE